MPNKESKAAQESLLPFPRDQYQDQQDSASSSLVHLSQSSSNGQPPSRDASPFIDLPHPDRWADGGEEKGEERDTLPQRGRSTLSKSFGREDAVERDVVVDEEEDDYDFDEWDPTSPPPSDMPSDLRPVVDRGKQHTPLLSADQGQYQDYESPNRQSLRTRRSTFKERDPEVTAKNAAGKKYVYAGCFLVLSLIAFTVQTETAVYIQHNLHWNKAYCML